MVAPKPPFSTKMAMAILIILRCKCYKNRVILQLNSFPPILAKFSAVPVFPAISIPSTLNVLAVLSYKRQKTFNHRFEILFVD
jgi:hypothetical protein